MKDAIAEHGFESSTLFIDAITVDTDTLVASSAAPSVPLPAAFPLFATALGGLGLLGWRRRRRASAAA